jgi:hypothetical protein
VTDAAVDPWAEYLKPPKGSLQDQPKDQPKDTTPVAAAQPAGNDPWATFTRRPGDKPGAAAGRYVGEHGPPAPTISSEVQGVAGDAGRGAEGLVGFAGDVQSAFGKIGHAVDRGVGKLTLQAMWKLGQLPVNPKTGKMMTPDEAQADIESHFSSSAQPRPEGVLGHVITGTLPTTQEVSSTVGPLWDSPQTVPGQFAGTVASFVPASLIGGFGSAREVAGRLMKWALAPGVADEAAGQATQGKPIEKAARVAAAIAGGGGAAMLTRESAAANAVGRAFEHIPEVDRPRYIQDAYRLMADAGGEGVGLTWEEALKRVSNGRVDLNAQRVVEGSGRLRGFMAQRGEQVDAATQRHLDAIAPPTGRPELVGPALGRAAGEHLQGISNDITAITRPLYQIAERADVGPLNQAALAADPAYAQGLRQVRSNPLLNAGIEGLPDSSGAVLDRTAKHLETRGSNLDSPVGEGEGQDRFQAAQARQAAEMPTQMLQAATGSRPIVPGVRQVGAYEMADELQQRLRATWLDPLMAGPMRKLRDQPQTQAAIQALWGDAQQGAAGVGETIAALTARGGEGAHAARQVVRQYVEGVFHEAQGAFPEQFVGAALSKTLMANPAVAERLAAAVNALPGGAHIWAGFDRFMEVLRATGERPRAGSMTTFNSEAMNEMKHNAGGPVGAAATTAKAVSSLGLGAKSWVWRKVEQWTLGKNLDELADLLVQPEAAQRFRQLAAEPPGSGRVIQLIGRLAAIAGQGVRHRRQPENDPTK